MIMKRNLDPSLIQWIMTTTGLGPGIGELFFVAPAKSATSQFRTQLESMGVKKIYTDIKTAYNATKTYRNDVVLVAPGAYSITEELDWTKSNTHMVGMGQRPYATDYYSNGVLLYTDTTGVVNTLHIAGNGNQFHNIYVANNAASVLTHAMKVGDTTEGFNNRFYGCSFSGIMNTTQVGVSSSVDIASGSTDYYFEDCVIGTNVFFARDTAAQGHVYYGGTVESGIGAGYGPQNGMWKDCRFYSQGTTVTCPMIRIEAGGNEAMDRCHIFKSCVFDNFSGTAATMNVVFDDDCLTWHNVRLHDCSAHGYAEWQDQDSAGSYYTTNMGTPQAADPGIGIVPTS